MMASNRVITQSQQYTKRYGNSRKPGKNAQQQYLEKVLHTATTAVNKLHREGLSVEHLELGFGKPKITVGWSPRCELLGVVVRCNRGIDSRGHYEECQVCFEGCDVIWTQK